MYFAKMPATSIDILSFADQLKHAPVLDVRSPLEFSHAHIPGAFSLPLFNDEQRKIIGTAYKQEGRQIAVDLGLGFFSKRMQEIHAETQSIIKNWEDKNGQPCTSLLIHCWRGGMRSEAVAWLLSLFGYKVYVLKGGYKSFRHWVNELLNQQYNFRILGGYTGSGKTEVLQQLKDEGELVIDLEGLAHHKGSAFGHLGQLAQPSQEMFENKLAFELFQIKNQSVDIPEIWMEDESRHIGKVGFNPSFWEQMRSSPLYFLDIPFENRLDFILQHYGKFEKELLIESVKKIENRLGGLDTKNAINYLNDGNYRGCFDILLKYYDKAYANALNKRDLNTGQLNIINAPGVNSSNKQLLVSK
jgi:tRNA 2-selenouridine synthase